MKYTFLFIIPLIMFIMSCSSVRTYTNTRKSEPQKSKTIKKTDNKTKELPKQIIKPKSRFTDTTKVVIKPNVRTTNISINSQLDSAIMNFENASEENNVDKLEKSCLEINSFAETFAEGDSLKFEAMFYKAECLIVYQKFFEAEKILSALIKDKNLPGSVLERALIRLGQVYCATGRKNEAQAMFVKFNKQFPNSIYKDIANCESIKQSE